MKKNILVLSILFGSTSWVLADSGAVTGKVVAVVAGQTILTGVVKSVSTADAARGTKSEIVIVDARGKITSVLVTSMTTLWTADAKPIMLDKIPPLCHVNVVFSTSETGINEGKSVKILK